MYHIHFKFQKRKNDMPKYRSIWFSPSCFPYQQSLYCWFSFWFILYLCDKCCIAAYSLVMCLSLKMKIERPPRTISCPTYFKPRINNYVKSEIYIMCHKNTFCTKMDILELLLYQKSQGTLYFLSEFVVSSYDRWVK